ncbi:MAG: PadR family transcriptional regulator [Novosphingobium sp.]|nr:PadR family transcriptional regulator [Novosphingobium sp.]
MSGPSKAMMSGTGFGSGFGRGFGRGFGADWDGEAGGPRGGHGRGGGRGRVFASGELRLVLLHLLGETPRHGYDLIKGVEELTGGAYAPSPGVVYPTLSLLTDEGAVTEQAAEGARRAYALTAAGRTELTARAEEAAALIDRLKALGEADSRHRAPPVTRAMGNLSTALRNRAREAEFDKETMHAVADILDDAARRIERL